MKATTVFKLLKCYYNLWRFDAMYKQTMNAVKGIGMGVLAGVAVAAIGTRAMNGGHRKMTAMKKNAGKAVHTMGNLIGDVEKMLK